ncbi:hypothetical protein Barb6_00241 [Bacteroidales bacterium Barb6]|nr:hypothetical protein Barb6_00241 [Bacteroidales bacterium Barb6]
MEQEVTLKPKVTLKRKGDAAPFTFNEKLQIDMKWSADTDLDLCLFWKTKDGKEGGVFSDGYNQNKNDLGSLDNFPFILHYGDEFAPGGGGESQETIRVKAIESLKELYVLVLNYDKAIDNIPSTFNQDSGRIEITTDTGDSLEVPVDSTDSGHVYLICKIENSDAGKKVINERRVLTLGQAFSQIPGFKLICS